jgi:hypothetical protein
MVSELEALNIFLEMIFSSIKSQYYKIIIKIFIYLKSPQENKSNDVSLNKIT